MRAVVNKWGNSASVRIPKAMMRAARLKLEDPVELGKESRRIVIEPLPRKEYVLAELVKAPSERRVEESYKKPGLACAEGKTQRQDCLGEIGRGARQAAGADRIRAQFADGNNATKELGISAGAFVMMAGVRSSSGQAADSAKPIASTQPSPKS